MREWRHWNFQCLISPLLYAIFMRSLCQWSRRCLYSAYFTYKQLFESTSCMREWRHLKLKINFSAASDNIYAHVTPRNRELNWAYLMLKNCFRKYSRYAQMTLFIFETIIEFSAAVRNVCVQLMLMNRRLTSTYIMLIWIQLWHPLTYLFHEEQEF